MKLLLPGFVVGGHLFLLSPAIDFLHKLSEIATTEVVLIVDAAVEIERRTILRLDLTHSLTTLIIVRSVLILIIGLRFKTTVAILGVATLSALATRTRIVSYKIYFVQDHIAASIDRKLPNVVRCLLRGSLPGLTLGIHVIDFGYDCKFYDYCQQARTPIKNINYRQLGLLLAHIKIAAH